MDKLNAQEIKNLVYCYAKKYEEDIRNVTMEDKELRWLTEEERFHYNEEKPWSEQTLDEGPLYNLYALGVTPDLELDYEDFTKNILVKDLMKAYQMWMNEEFGLIPENLEDYEPVDLNEIRKLLEDNKNLFD